MPMHKGRLRTNAATIGMMFAQGALARVRDTGCEPAVLSVRRSRTERRQAPFTTLQLSMRCGTALFGTLFAQFLCIKVVAYMKHEKEGFRA